MFMAFRVAVATWLRKMVDAGGLGAAEIKYPIFKVRVPPISDFQFQVFVVASQLDTAFNPIIEPIRVVIKNSLQKVAGSLNTKIPINTVPTAPIPVQTA